MCILLYLCSFINCVHTVISMLLYKLCAYCYIYVLIYIMCILLYLCSYINCCYASCTRPVYMMRAFILLV